MDKSGTPVKRHKKEWRDVFHLRALQYNVSYGTLPGELAKRHSTRARARREESNQAAAGPGPRDDEWQMTCYGPLLRHFKPIVGVLEARVPELVRVELLHRDQQSRMLGGLPDHTDSSRSRQHSSTSCETPWTQ